MESNGEWQGARAGTVGGAEDKDVTDQPTVTMTNADLIAKARREYGVGLDLSPADPLGLQLADALEKAERSAKGWSQDALLRATNAGDERQASEEGGGGADGEH